MSPLAFWAGAGAGAGAGAVSAATRGETNVSDSAAQAPAAARILFIDVPPIRGDVPVRTVLIARNPGPHHNSGGAGRGVGRPQAEDQECARRAGSGNAGADRDVVQADVPELEDEEDAGVNDEGGLDFFSSKRR